MHQRQTKPPAIDSRRADEAIRLVTMMRKRMFWLNTVFVCMLLLAAIVGVAQYLGINARSPGWEPLALIAAFGAIGAALVIGLIGFGVRHVQVHRLARQFLEEEGRQ